MFLNTTHHVAIIVSDYEKSRKFYVEQLELPIIRENFQEHRGTYKLDLKVGDIELEIIRYSLSHREIPYFQGNSI